MNCNTLGEFIGIYYFSPIIPPIIELIKHITILKGNNLASRLEYRVIVKSIKKVSWKIIGGINTTINEMIIPIIVEAIV